MESIKDFISMMKEVGHWDAIHDISAFLVVVFVFWTGCGREKNYPHLSMLKWAAVFLFLYFVTGS